MFANEQVGGFAHGISVQWAERPADPAQIDARADSGFVQHVSVATRCSASTAMEFLGRYQSPLHGNVPGQVGIGTTHPSMRVALQWGIKMNHLHDAVIYEMARKQALWLALVFAILGFVIVFYAFAA